jgi:hypothetical protein
MTASASFEDDERHSQTVDSAEDRAGSTAVNEPTASEDVDPLPKDVVFGLLSNDRRRWVLRCLAEGSGETTLSDLAEQLASIENDKPVGALSSTERKRVYICLY